MRELLNRLIVEAPDLYLVGGAVRDLLLSGDLCSIKDFDFVSVRDTEPLVAKMVVEYGAELKLFPDFFTCKLVFHDGFEIDIARARTETYKRPGALPTVSLAKKIDEDLSRRDFTINAMALKITDLDNIDNVLDFFGGREDLKKRQIKVLHDRSFIDDPTRIFRGFRYAGRFGYAIESNTMQLIRGATLNTISKSRIIKELKKISLEDEAYKIFVDLLESGVLRGCGLYSNEEQLLLELSNKERFLAENRDARLKYFLSLCYKAATKDERLGYIRDFQLGKKFVRELAE